MHYSDQDDAIESFSRALTITLWTLQILAALIFLNAGGAKLAGAPQMVALFAKVGLGQWFRYATGLLEVAGAILLLVPRYAFYGAGLLMSVMVGAIVSHLTVLGGSAVPSGVLLLLTGTIAFLRRPRDDM